MIKVCVMRRGGECWRFPNSSLNRALAFARIGSQHGHPRRVSVCGHEARVYSDGIKVRGARRIQELRRKARACR